LISESQLTASLLQTHMCACVTLLCPVCGMWTRVYTPHSISSQKEFCLRQERERGLEQRLSSVLPRGLKIKNSGDGTLL